MNKQPLLSGISARTVPTARLAVHVLEAGPADGIPVVFVHGNVSAARFWEETMLALPDGYRAIAPDLAGYGDTEARPIDAAQGMQDWAADLDALATALDLGPFHLVGWSLGGGVAMQYTQGHADRLLSLTLVSAMSPFGFGGTKDVAGTPTFADFAGSGAGTANPEFARRLAEGDASSDSPFSPRNVMNAFYFKPPFRVAPDREDAFVEAMLSTRSGVDFYPGDPATSPHWPTVAPGTRGINNAIAPAYCDLRPFAGVRPQPPVLWVRGADDQIVSDTSLFDFGFLGQIGAVPGWPGSEVFPPQPMVGQLRRVLDAYAAAGGRYREEVLADCGHSPHIEQPAAFNALLLGHLQS
jgi:pimeloyl-ACP methyl ester carboxylesterase